MMSSIIISNYAGVGFVLFAVLLFAFALGSAHGYDQRAKHDARRKMSREWCMSNHPTNDGGHK